MTRRWKGLLLLLFVVIAAACGESRQVEVSLDQPFAGSPDIAELRNKHIPNPELDETPTRCFSCDDHLDNVSLTSGNKTVVRYPLITLTFDEWAPESESGIAMMFDYLNIKSLGPLVDWFSKQPGASIYSDARDLTNPCDANCNEPLLNAHNCSSSKLAVCRWSILANGLRDGNRPYYAILSGAGPGKTNARLTLTYGTLP